MIFEFKMFKSSGNCNYVNNSIHPETIRVFASRKDFINLVQIRELTSS